VTPPSMWPPAAGAGCRGARDRPGATRQQQAALAAARLRGRREQGGDRADAVS
jgi:hypothetical protein